MYRKNCRVHGKLKPQDIYCRNKEKNYMWCAICMRESAAKYYARNRECIIEKAKAVRRKIKINSTGAENERSDNVNTRK
jgi:hypothetical protein